MTKTSSKIQVSVVRETAKALLVQDADGREGWIQRRWLSADSTVKAETFEKAVASAEERKADKQAAQDFRNNFHQIIVVRETEKAVGCEIHFDLCDIERNATRMVWFPKSRCQRTDDGWAAQGWMILAKEDEARAEVYNGGRVGSVIIEVGCTGSYSY
jgi:SH3-like domain-containing protein